MLSHVKHLAFVDVIFLQVFVLNCVFGVQTIDCMYAGAGV